MSRVHLEIESSGAPEDGSVAAYDSLTKTWKAVSLESSDLAQSLVELKRIRKAMSELALIELCKLNLLVEG